MAPLVHSEYYIGVFLVSKSPPKHILFNYYVDPLSSYPTLEQLSQLECDQWLQLGVRLGLGNDQLETIKKSQHPTAATLQAAKIKNIDMQWKDIVEALVSIGEYKLAESVCTQQGQQMTASVKLLAFVTFLFWEIPTRNNVVHHKYNYSTIYMASAQGRSKRSAGWSGFSLAATSR